jgi:ABC-2 type transport system permease protein
VRIGVRQLLRGALIWGAVFALLIVTSIFAYESTYGTAAERQELLRGIASNNGLRALFGPARAIDTVRGFLAWRTLGLLPPIAAVWGLLAATRLLRGEEDSGRWETLLSGPITRARATLAMLTGVGIGFLALFALTAASILLAGAAPGKLSIGEGLWLGLALCIAAPAFAAVGALAAQLAATRREAAALASAIFAAAFVLRVAADGSQSAGWLRWLTPLGWIEEMRPLTGARPLGLVPLVAWIALLTWAAVLIARRRDAGASVLPHSDKRAPRHLFLGSPTAFSLRESLGGLVGWSLAMALTGFMFGFIANAVADLARESEGLRKHVETTTAARIDITSAEGYLAIVFVFLAVTLSLYAASHATAAREEEASGRLDTVLAQSVSRRRWLAGRVLVGAACCVAVALVTAVAAWAGAAIKAAGVDLGDMLETSLNMLPVVALFLGLGTLAVAFVPRHTGAVAFGAVGGAYLWEQTGALVKAPDWVLAASPFHWLALVPSESFDVVASVVMLAIGVAAAVIGIERFARRDLVAA